MTNRRLPGFPPGLPNPYQQPSTYPPPGAQQLYPDQRSLPPRPQPNAIKSWWLCDDRALLFAAPTPAQQGVSRTAQISSPLFDLRPDLKHSNARTSPAIPIWRPNGGGLLYVQVSRINAAATALNDLEIRYQERGNCWAADKVSTTTALEDLTHGINAGQQSCVFTFQAPGTGYNMRYWGLTLNFNILVALTPAPPMVVSMAFY
jgi:hypothetical protein